MKINNIMIEAQNNEILLKQDGNTIRIPLVVEDTEQILSKMQNPSYAELVEERRAHQQRQNEYAAALQMVEEEYERVYAHFQKVQQKFFTGAANLSDMEKTRAELQIIGKRLEDMKETGSNWVQLSNVTQHDENSVYGSYRAALTDVDGGSLEQLRKAREALEMMLAFVNEKIYEQNNHIWNFNQTIQRNAFMPRGHRLSLHGHYLSKPKPNKESVYGKKAQ